MGRKRRRAPSSAASSQRFTLLKPRQGELNDQNRVFGGKPHGRQHTDLKVDIVFVSGEQRSAHGPKNA